jgi:sugar lactone lactonase YvrE
MKNKLMRAYSLTPVKLKISILLCLLLVPCWGWAAKGPTQATKVSISLVDGIAVSPNGDTYIARRAHNVISRIDQKGRLVNVVGTGYSGYSGDGGPATKAAMNIPAGLAFDRHGNLYIADRANHRVRKVDKKGIITTVAGNGTAGFSGDGGPATKASLNLPSGVVVDNKGNLYISDRSNNRVRMVNTKGIIQTFAGNGNDGYHGDNMPALKATLDKPFGLALDKDNNLYIADRGNNRIRKIDSSGLISTVAGDGGFYFIGDNGPAYRASIAGPTGVTVDGKGNIFIADRSNNRIRMVDRQGMIRTIMGTGQQDYNGDSELARETNLHLPFGVALDKNGDLLVVDRSHYRIRKLIMKGSKVTTVAGNGVKQFGGDGGPSQGANLEFPHGIDVDSKDNVIFADKAHYRIRKITPKGIISTIAGNGIRGNIGDRGPALKASIHPFRMRINDKDEIFFISPSGFVSLVRKVNTKGIISEYITTGDAGYQKAVLASGSGVSTKSDITVISQFSDLMPDKKGNLYLADRINHQVRILSPNGKIKTVAGTGESNYFGDGGPATKAAFRDPAAITLDKAGNLYVADAANNMVRKIDTKGIISTIAGNGKHKDSGDGGPALEASLRSIDSLAFNPAGELHIVETNTHHIRKIKKDGTIVTVAGRPGIQGNFGDGGPATKGMLKQPADIAFDSKGNMYITDMGNNSIRKVDTKGIITTLAGAGIYSAGWDPEGEHTEILFGNFP